MLYVADWVCGVTQLDKVMYVVCEGSHIIQTFSVDTFSPLADIPIKGMRRPVDIVVCREDRQVFVGDKDRHDGVGNHCIWRVSADNHSNCNKWLSAESTKGTFAVNALSVTSQGLLVTSSDPPSLREYSRIDRSLLRDIKLPEHVKYLYHGIELPCGTFEIAHKGTFVDPKQSAVSQLFSCHHSA